MEVDIERMYQRRNALLESLIQRIAEVEQVKMSRAAYVEACKTIGEKPSNLANMPKVKDLDFYIGKLKASRRDLEYIHELEGMSQHKFDTACAKLKLQETVVPNNIRFDFMNTPCADGNVFDRNDRSLR